jgi:hypothetical protein
MRIKLSRLVCPRHSAADHCVKPENWDDNYSVSPRFVRFTDGQGDFAAIKARQSDTATIQIVSRVGSYEGDPHAVIVRQTEIWYLQDVGGKVLLTRTITAVRSTPPSRQDTQGLLGVAGPFTRKGLYSNRLLGRTPGSPCRGFSYRRRSPVTASTTLFVSALQ